MKPVALFTFSFHLDLYFFYTLGYFIGRLCCPGQLFELFNRWLWFEQDFLVGVCLNFVFCLSLLATEYFGDRVK